MAEMTERDREIADRIYFEDPDKDAVTAYIAAYREECVAEERAARLKAEGERDEARDWVRRMHAESQTLTCVYCGHAYPPGTSASGESVLTEHIKVCEKHPMRQAEARLRAVIEALRAVKDAAWTDSDHCALCGEDPCASGCVMHAVRSALRDAQPPASPEPEASKQAGHAFHNFWLEHPHDFVAGALSLCDAVRADGAYCSFAERSHLCVHCGLPWSKHGGRDGE